MRHRVGRYWRRVTAVSLIGFASISTPSVQADPPADTPVSPFPELAHIATWYNELPPDQFFLPGSPGVWFVSPSGLNCGMWHWGSFGCSGDIPGAPADVHHIAWFNGNRGVHYGWTAAMQFPSGQAQQVLPPRSYVSYESTTCATTPDGSTYCEHGDFRFLITQTRTWLKGWDDKRSYVCLSYGSCPS